jgi:hypothetical protein
MATITLLRERRVAKIARWVFAALVLCAIAPAAVADDLGDHLYSLWAPAAVLSLALVTAVNRFQK